MCPAIHITSRSWLRSSSTREPSDPPLRVVFFFFFVLNILRGADVNATRSTDNGSQRVGSGREETHNPRSAGNDTAHTKTAAALRRATSTYPKLAPKQKKKGKIASQPGHGKPNRALPTEIERHDWKKRDASGSQFTPGGGGKATVMILPQVHLRKPCYDFYFL
jgi:hypothetical protein